MFTLRIQEFQIRIEPVRLETVRLLAILGSLAAMNPQRQLQKAMSMILLLPFISRDDIRRIGWWRYIRGRRPVFER
jgi:hypothetical protein